MKQWYVVHTLPRGEEIAFQNLIAQGYETFLPRYNKVRKHARKMDVVLSSLFPRYLFVMLDVAVDRWLSVDSTRGVAYILRSMGCPIAVPEGIIEALKTRADEKEAVPLSSLEIFKKGAILEILEGAFVGQTAIYEKMADHERVELLLTLMGRNVKLAVSLHAVAEVA